MAAKTVIYSASDDYSGQNMTAQAVPQKYTKSIGGKVVIGRHVIIGSACTIIGESTIGIGCSIGSSTLVIKDLNPWGFMWEFQHEKSRTGKKFIKIKKKLLKTKKGSDRPYHSPSSL